MRITSVHPGAVALVFAVMYAFFGFVAFVIYAFSSVHVFLLPIGLVMGVFHLVFNIQLVRSPDILANVFLCLLAMLCYGLTGCITGGIVALCFNFIAEKTGGIDAKFVSVDDNNAEEPEETGGQSHLRS